MRRITRARWHILALSALALALIAAPTLGLSTRFLVWNPTASVPRGLYVRDDSPPSRGSFALAWLPTTARELAHERGYLPRTVPALKPIAAMAGDVVCANAERITINGAVAATRRRRDFQDREMPWWEGCETMSAEQIFLLSTYAGESFDGRYFGPSHTSDVIEKVSPLWTFE